MQYVAKGKIHHNHKLYLPGDVVDLPADEKKSDLFVPVAKAPKEKKAKASKPESAPEGPPPDEVK